MRIRMPLPALAASALCLIVAGIPQSVLADKVATFQTELDAIDLEIAKLEKEITDAESDLSAEDIQTLRSVLSDTNIVVCAAPAPGSERMTLGSIDTREACSARIQQLLTDERISPEKAVRLAMMTGSLTRAYRQAIQELIKELEAKIAKNKKRLIELRDERARLQARQRKPQAPAATADAGSGAVTRDEQLATSYWVRQPAKTTQSGGVTATANSIKFTDKEGSNEMKWEGIPDRIGASNKVAITYSVTANHGAWIEAGIRINGGCLMKETGRRQGLTSDPRFPDLHKSAFEFQWNPDAAQEVTITMFAGNGHGAGEGSVTWIFVKE